jgi:hypothetical protein
MEHGGRCDYTKSKKCMKIKKLIIEQTVLDCLSVIRVDMEREMSTGVGLLSILVILTQFSDSELSGEGLFGMPSSILFYSILADVMSVIWLAFAGVRSRTVLW